MYVPQESQLYAINSNGTLRWVYTPPKKITDFWPSTAPALDGDGNIYLGAGGKLWAFNSNGTLRWTSAALYPRRSTYITIQSSPAIGGDGTIFMGGSWLDGKLYAIGPGAP